MKTPPHPLPEDFRGFYRIGIRLRVKGRLYRYWLTKDLRSTGDVLEGVTFTTRVAAERWLLKRIRSFPGGNLCAYGVQGPEALLETMAELASVQ